MLKAIRRTSFNRKKRVRSIRGDMTVYFLLLVIGAFMALPMIYAVLTAFKPFEEIFIFPPRFFVRRPILDNFIELFNIASNLWVPFSRYIFNSVFVACAGTSLHVLLASMAAYPLAKHDFPGKGVINGLVLISIMFVAQVTFIPQYIILAKMGFINTYPALILPPVGTALGCYLMIQFIKQIPVSLLESARIDGANEYRIFFSIVFPNVKPAWLTLTMFSFQLIWNNPPMQMTFNEELKLLPTALSQIISGNVISRMGVGMAANIFLMLPPLILFIVVQDKIIETMTYAGIKG